MKHYSQKDTICAISTPIANGAIAIVRISGEMSLVILKKIFQTKVATIQPRKVHFGQILDGENILDDVLVSYFQAPKSFTGEDMVEISTHGSLYIQERLIALLIENGCRMATAGEFTQRAFLNGKLDLSQAESIADLIAAQSRASHDLAMKNLRGQISIKIAQLREQLLHFSALLELELDFSEEDVEFADRTQFLELIENIKKEINKLLTSFYSGNAIKKGINVAIVGRPNVGKSTLLNALLKEDRAIVSEISGTTRDTIEDTMQIDGFLFRFVDTAGIRESKDNIEQLGIERSFVAINKAMVILWVVDAKNISNLEQEALELFSNMDLSHKKVFLLLNKVDETPISNDFTFANFITLPIAAQKGFHISKLEQMLAEYAHSYCDNQEVMISNIRHYQALQKALDALLNAEETFNKGLSTDLVAVDIRQTIYYLSEVVGEVSNEDILTEIFSNFCIGK